MCGSESTTEPSEVFAVYVYHSEERESRLPLNSLIWICVGPGRSVRALEKKNPLTISTHSLTLSFMPGFSNPEAASTFQQETGNLHESPVAIFFLSLPVFHIFVLLCSWGYGAINRWQTWCVAILFAIVCVRDVNE